MAAFSPALIGSFHLDDYSLLADPPSLYDLHTRNQPLTRFTYWLNFQMTGASPVGFHAMNLALHLASVWFAITVLERLLPSRTAFFAAALFALHPIQTEAVAYVFARSTLLAGLLCLISLDQWTRGHRWTAVLWHAAALLAKEDAVALPLVIATIELAWKPIATMLAASLAVGLRGLYLTANTAGAGAGLGSRTSPLDYLHTQGDTILSYLAKLIYPPALNFDAEIAGSWLTWFVVAILAALALRFAPRRQWIIAMLLFLAPTSSLLPLDDCYAERRMYLALFALCAALAPALSPSRVWILAIILAAFSFQRALIFRTEESLWRDTMAKSPTKLRPKLQLARAVRPVEAIAILEPLRDQAPSELGRAYLEAGRPADALALFGQVLAREPGNPAAVTNRGTALAALGQNDAALADFRRALSMDPCLTAARENFSRLGGGDPPPCPSIGRP